MKPYRKFKKFQIRWKEKLGRPECPYLYRWTFLFFGYSIRIHHWLKSDDRRYFHDHGSDLISIILKGRYKNVVPAPERHDGKKEIEVKAGQIWRAEAEAKHYLDIPTEGAWTLLFFWPKRSYGIVIPSIKCKFFMIFKFFI
ncbi:unnamed protein product [marine sediment metagenome]|uniref:Uncharacterized protein n=1 Tax=marine sediment metagenome TaxID=412755 RepID=X1ART2_9ZZZZ